MPKSKKDESIVDMIRDWLGEEDEVYYEEISRTNSPKLNWTLVKRYLQDINFPISKGELMDSVRNKGADLNLVTKLERIEDRTYENFDDVSNEIKKII